MTKLRLYEIGNDLLDLEQRLADNDGELSDEDLDRYLNLQNAETKRIEELALWVKDLDGQIAFYQAQVAALDALIAEEKKRYLDRVTQLANTQARVVQRLKVHFITVRDKEPLKTARVEVKIGKVGGLRAMSYPVEWDQDPARAPERFHRRKIELDKKAMREAAEERDRRLEEKNDVDFHDVAMVTIEPQKEKLIIK